MKKLAQTSTNQGLEVYCLSFFEAEIRNIHGRDHINVRWAWTNHLSRRCSALLGAVHDIREKRINQWIANLSAANCDEKLSIPRHKDDWWWFASVSRASLFTKLEFTFEFVVDNALKSILNHNSYLITRMAGNKIIKHIVSQIAMLGIIRDSSLFASPITSCNTQNSCANELLW